ncbi:MAG: glycosyltransferase family 9 protein [Desulfobacterales bacterium]|jgi:heptosyltransferase I
MPRVEAQKICLIRTSAVGDVIHALALVNGLRKGFPDAHLTWIIEKVPYEVVKLQPTVDRFIIFERNDGWNAWRKLFLSLKKERYDLLLLPQVSLKAGLISMLVRADIKLGFDWRRSREFHGLFTNRKLEPRSPQHVQDHYFEFLQYLEIKDYPLEWNFVFSAEELSWRQSFFKQFDRPVISFVVSSAIAERNWHARGFAEVMDYVDVHLKMQPMIVGGPSRQERLEAEKILQHCKCSPGLALEKPIRNTLLQLSGSVLVVAPDTGPLHAAVALNIPTVGLYGFTDPRRTGPYQRYHDLLIDRYLDEGEQKTPIRRTTRSGRMQRIAPADVIEKIELGLKKYAPGT